MQVSNSIDRKQMETEQKVFELEILDQVYDI